MISFIVGSCTLGLMQTRFAMFRRCGSIIWGTLWPPWKPAVKSVPPRSKAVAEVTTWGDNKLEEAICKFPTLRWTNSRRTGPVESETKPFFDGNNEPVKISAAVFLRPALQTLRVAFTLEIPRWFNMRQTLSFTWVRGIDSKIVSSAALEYTSENKWSK